MITRVIWKFAVCLLVMVTAACSRDELEGGTGEQQVPEGYLAIQFGTNVPDMQQVSTRSVDSDGRGIQDMVLYCFSASGSFITTVEAKIVTDPIDPNVNASLSGSFSAIVPDYTKIIHFVANQNLTDFNESEMGGKHESDLMATLIASSGRMIYWQRVACEEGEDNMAVALEREGKKIVMVRNQARVTVKNPQNSYVNIDAFTTHNTHAFGTVAPYNSETHDFEWTPGVKGYLSLPANDEQIHLEGTEDGSFNLDEKYILECENELSDPVSVILHGENGKYYRVLLLDEESEPLPIRRDHSYNIEIVGPLSYGYDSFAEALDGTPTNNVWISVPDDINEVSDGTHRLIVDETFVVYLGTTTRSVDLTYRYEVKNGDGEYGPETTGQVLATWVGGGTTVATSEIKNVYDNNTGIGTLTITLNQLGQNETKREGIIQVKAGKLRRTIKVITVREFKFEPTWTSAQIYGNVEGQPVTLMFTIPEDFPEELLPLRVKIGADWLNIRQSTGQQLATITSISNPDEFSENDPWKFKFVYEATHTGVQRVYFNTVLKPEKEGDAYKNGTLTIEAEHFITLEKVFPFSDHNYYISIGGLIDVNGSNLGDEMPDGETVYYCLVPQKVSAPVTFDVQLREEKEGGGNDPVVSDENDVFLLYSQYLTRYDDEDIPGGAGNKECHFEPIDEETWGTGGRVFSFTPVQKGKSDYKIYLKTDRPNSAEVIRIASSESNPEVGYEYKGNHYRSITFELANNDPFKFSGKLKNGNLTINANESGEWSYEVGQEVDLEFDITSFRGTDNKSADPFGTEFKVYIDAPMLEIDDNRRGSAYPEEIFKEDPNVEGRFIYVVKAKRDENRNGTNDVAIKDVDNGNTTVNPNEGPADQRGEHKVLPFKTKSIVSAGEITISADENVVIFSDESFTIANTPITGTIEFSEDGKSYSPVPKDGFVTFEVEGGSPRIGSMTITEDGKYTLRLRKEYRYDWERTKIWVHYRVDDKIYHADVNSLKELFENSTIKMNLEQ